MSIIRKPERRDAKRPSGELLFGVLLLSGFAAASMLIAEVIRLADALLG